MQRVIITGFARFLTFDDRISSFFSWGSLSLRLGVLCAGVNLDIGAFLLVGV